VAVVEWVEVGELVEKSFAHIGILKFYNFI